MTIREKVFSMRMNEFGFGRVTFFGSDKDVFPNKIHIVKWVTCAPMEVYSVDEKEYTKITTYCYAIGSIEWNSHEACWDFLSIGTRYLEDGTEQLNRWILDFCKKYSVVDGELTEVEQ